jgi:hypothetical protein
VDEHTTSQGASRAQGAHLAARSNPRPVRDAPPPAAPGRAHFLSRLQLCKPPANMAATMRSALQLPASAARRVGVRTLTVDAKAVREDALYSPE